jgi:hypothetical protein
MDGDDFEAISRTNEWQGKSKYTEGSGPPQTPHDLSRAAAVGSRRLTLQSYGTNLGLLIVIHINLEVCHGWVAFSCTMDRSAGKQSEVQTRVPVTTQVRYTAVSCTAAPTELYLQTHTHTHKKKTPWPLVRKRTIPTEQPPLVGEI